MNSSEKTKEIKKGHYVPQFYLKKFTHDGYRLFVFDKFAKKLTTKILEGNMKAIDRAAKEVKSE